MADQNNRLHHDTIGFGLAAAITIIGNALLVWAKESYPPLLAWMKAVAPHHWVTHSIIILATFLLLGWFLSNTKLARRVSGTMLAYIIVIATVIGGLGVFGFYLQELLG